jgi:DNA-binding transcriptional ArsR family regulator
MAGEAEAAVTEDLERLRAQTEAMADPILSRILYSIGDELFAAAEDPGASVRQLAEHLGEPKRKIRYHLGKLADQGLVVVAGKRVRRGVVENYYRVKEVGIITAEQLGSLSDARSRQIAQQIVRAVVSDVSTAVAAKTLGARPGWAALRIPGKVDLQGWEELGGIHEQTLYKIQEVLEGSQRRLAESGEEAISSVSALLLFDLPRVSRAP